jgi:peptide/nickel transport system permease protein
MLKFILRRFLNYLVLVAVATVMAYLLASMALNPRARYENRNPPFPETTIDKILNDLNTNPKTPIPQRFVRWGKGVAHGDFGKTFAGEPISDEMGRRIGVSLRLLLIGAILGATLGVTVGVWGAVRQHRVSDNVATVASFVILSTPVFLLAVLIKLSAIQLNESLGRTLLYTTGEMTPGLAGGWFANVADRVGHLILPTLTLTLGGIAIYSRYQRSTMLDVMGAEYLRTAQAKGLRRRKALVKHGLRTALIPMATFFAYTFGLLVVGAAFTEKIFGWHGMGEWLIDSISNQDINAVVAVTAFTAVMILIAGMLSDIMTAALDPRVRIR